MSAPVDPITVLLTQIQGIEAAQATQLTSISNSLQQILASLKGQPVNTLTVNNIVATTQQEQPVPLAAQATDSIVGAVISYKTVTLPKNGTLTPAPGQTGAFAQVYKPNTGFSGIDSFIFDASDDRGQTSNQATATITVTPVAKTVIKAQDTAVVTQQDTPVAIDLSSKISDSDSTATISKVLVNTNAGSGATTAQNTTITYKPNAGFTGIDAFTYQAVDSKNNHSNIARIALTVTPKGVGGGSVDAFGIQKIYDDRQGTYNNWTQTSASDSRFFEGRVADAGNGWLKAAGGSTEIRIEVLSDTSANENTIPTFDVGKVIKQGYLYKPIDSPDGKGDFGDFEMTWRVKGQAGTGTKNGECHTELVPGGYRQTSDMTKVGKDKAVPAACEAMSYHFNCYPLSGRVKYEKDSMHTNGYTKTDPEIKNAIAKFDSGQEIIQKAVLYRTANGVKLETYVDESGSGTNFKKVLEFEDDGKWGPTRGGNGPCNCGEYPILSMGRVALGYRGDNWNSFEFKDASIRSIDSGKPLHAAHKETIKTTLTESRDESIPLTAEELVKAKADADEVAIHARDEKIKADAAKVAKELEDQLKSKNKGADSELYGEELTPAEKAEQTEDEIIGKKVDKKLDEKNIKITGKLTEEK